jgi:subtilisin family serine protease
MRVRDRSWYGFALSICLTTSLAACGADMTGPNPEESSALTSSQPQTYLVSFTGGGIPANADAIVSAAGGTIVTSYANLGVVLVKSSSASFASTLRADSRVDSVGSSKTVSSAVGVVKGKKLLPKPIAAEKRKASDALSYRQWDMDQIHAPQARPLAAAYKTKALVGVLDSGVDITHPDLVGQVKMDASASCVGGVANNDPAVWANDIIGHGTHVSGIIAGKKNGSGIVGVAPDSAQIAAVKLAVDDVNDPNFGLVFADAFVCAIDWAIGHNFDLMNASLTIDPFTAPIDDLFCSDEPDRAAIVKMVRQAVLKASTKNITLLASTGNMFLDLANIKGQTPGSTCKVLPVQLPRVIGVSSVGFTQQLSWFSDYGKGAVDLTGPGGDNVLATLPLPAESASGQVLSSVPPNSLYYGAAADWNGQVQDCSTGTCSTYAYLQGTSQAVPHATAIAALATVRWGRLPFDKLLARMALSATRLPCPATSPYDPGMTGQPATCSPTLNGNNFYGWGEVDALALMNLPQLQP